MNIDDKPSKSQRKRDMIALQKLAESLTGLSSSELARIPLETTLLEAIESAKKLKTHEAKRRQFQYLGKLMRHHDVELIRKALEKIRRLA